ncbi:hypothetical protein [Bacillus toyonensis]|uniref:hypothetical protein n=1 Tax=Bacillus toyonensis TaxID=155322 RepID=UPI000BEC7F70|nr:hypothetical protein [Bacillus toyonensis]MBU4641986.1 hypothetical protein [Bacillus toyonensis]MCU5395772.1 hypothetical protein [Bacillus toyonensis]PEC10069.1 hypothetical protein CON55_15160 [Bacillus toyonensis]PEC36168.1 hypothetical protein CON60_28590 [Bacillus toyonensis]PED57639.1 hypothetical protein CON89_30390 [Bacillus toyonensis]
MGVPSVFESALVIGDIQPIISMLKPEAFLRAVIFFIVIWILISVFCIYHKYATNKAEKHNSRDQSK